MALFWKCTAGVLIAVVLVLTVGREEKDIALMLAMTACVMTVLGAFSFIRPVLDFLYRLEELASLKTGVLGTLLKITGIAIVTEISCMILNDSGTASLAKAMQLLGMAVMLSLSLPFFETLLEMLQEILGV